MAAAASLLAKGFSVPDSTHEQKAESKPLLSSVLSEKRRGL
jgi:hypothetical protein